MNYDQKQTMIEINRQRLTDIILSIGCSPWDAAQFAIEEYFLELPCDEYSYHNYREHFINRYIKDERFDGTKSYRFGTVMTEILIHLFDVQISKAYMVIKTAVYKKMDELKETDDLWEFGRHIADFEDWVSAWTQEFCDGDNEIVDADWIIKKKNINKQLKLN